jgi:hypothetical protein
MQVQQQITQQQQGGTPLPVNCVQASTVILASSMQLLHLSYIFSSDACRLKALAHNSC